MHMISRHDLYTLDLDTHLIAILNKLLSSSPLEMNWLFVLPSGLSMAGSAR